MVLIALKQKNWIRAESQVNEIALSDPESKLEMILSAVKAANENKVASYLLSIWAEIRWDEINDEENYT